MAFGLPVVCYDRGGQTDFLATGVTGHVAPLNDTHAFTLAVRDLHENSEARQRCGAHNLQLVENYFIDTCAARYEEVFTSVVEQGTTRASPNVARRLKDSDDALVNR